MQLFLISLQLLIVYNTKGCSRVQKLDYDGIRGSLLQWTSHFLTKRSQHVIIDSQASEWAPVTSGVPQGAVLGLDIVFLLFLTFINDMIFLTSHLASHDVQDHLKHQ